MAEREERERRRAEAAKAKEEAKRYPMEDLELLEELRQRAAEAGERLLGLLGLLGWGTARVAGRRRAYARSVLAILVPGLQAPLAVWRAAQGSGGWRLPALALLAPQEITLTMQHSSVTPFRPALPHTPPRPGEEGPAEDVAQPSWLSVEESQASVAPLFPRLLPAPLYWYRHGLAAGACALILAPLAAAMSGRPAGHLSLAPCHACVASSVAVR